MRSSIISERLIIDPLAVSDREFFHELANTEGWFRSIGDKNIHSPDDAFKYIKQIIGDIYTNYWTVRLKNKTPIGIVSFIKRAYLDYPDIGFAFLPSFTREGYVYEATNAVLHHIIHCSKLSYIMGVTIGKDATFIKLLNKLGLQFQKEIEVGDEKLQVYQASADKLFISEITNSFFKVFTNANDSLPDFELLNHICMPHIKIIHQKNYESDVYDLISFIVPRKKMLSDGTLTDFEEKEVFEETKIMDHKALRYSEYEKTGVLNGKKFKEKGRKLFQFIKTNQSWKISSVRWEDTVI